MKSFSLVRGIALCTFLVLAAVAVQAADDAMDLAAFQADIRTRVLAADTDKDGVVSREELAQHRDATLATAPGGRGGKQPRAFARLDVNGDGKLDGGEIDKLSARLFERLDADHDGRVTTAERTAAHEHARSRLRDFAEKRQQ